MDANITKFANGNINIKVVDYKKYIACDRNDFIAEFINCDDVFMSDLHLIFIDGCEYICNYNNGKIYCMATYGYDIFTEIQSGKE